MTAGSSWASWDYRIVRYAGGTGYGLHEVYYDDAGLAWSMTSDPISFSCPVEEGPGGVRGSLRLAQRAIERPIFDEPEKGKWPGKAPGGNMAGMVGRPTVTPPE